MAASTEDAVAGLRERLTHEPSERVLLAEIERSLEPLRIAYSKDRSVFSEDALATLKRAAEMAKGLRLFLEVTGEIGDVSDLTAYTRAESDLTALLTQFDGTAVAARIRRELVGLQHLRPMLGVLDPPPPDV